MKAKIYINQASNDLLGQKLPTYRNGFCYIEREVVLCADPEEIYEEGEYGRTSIMGHPCVVTRCGQTGSFEVDKVYP